MITIRQIKEEFPDNFKEMATYNFEIGNGWLELVYQLIKDVVKIDPNLQILQIKEKFGGLRFYYSSAKYEEINKLVDEAEGKSYETCEFTGKPGKERSVGYWTKTSCDEFYEEALKRGSWMALEQEF